MIQISDLTADDFAALGVAPQPFTGKPHGYKTVADWMTVTLRHELQAPMLRWIEARSLNDTQIMLGFITDPPPAYKSGPNKGRPNYSKVTQHQHVVSRVTMEALRRQFESATSSCSNCFGCLVQSVGGGTKPDGRTYRVVKACGCKPAPEGTITGDVFE